MRTYLFTFSISLEFQANFNKPDEDNDTLWRVRTLRGRVKLTGASWADAMTRCMERIAVNTNK